MDAIISISAAAFAKHIQDVEHADEWLARHGLDAGDILYVSPNGSVRVEGGGVVVDDFDAVRETYEEAARLADDADRDVDDELPPGSGWCRECEDHDEVQTGHFACQPPPEGYVGGRLEGSGWTAVRADDLEPIRNLDTLRDAMLDNDPRTLDQHGQWRSGLPTFGGEEPSDTAAVWSWDETRLLVGESADDLRIVHREDW